MYVKDTNVASELIRPSPSPAVAAWIAGRDAEELYLTAVNEAELLYGVAIVPADCQIAAIARCRGMAVATRNLRDFGDIDVEFVDPWTAA